VLSFRGHLCQLLCECAVWSTLSAATDLQAVLVFRDSLDFWTCFLNFDVPRSKLSVLEVHVCQLLNIALHLSQSCETAPFR